MDRPRNSLFQIHRCAFLSTADAELVVGLVARVCDPSIDATVGERRHQLCHDLAELVDADVWFSAIGARPVQGADESEPQIKYDGGWRDESQRVDAISVGMEREMQRIVSDVTSSAFAKQRTLTYIRDQAVLGADDYVSPSGRRSSCLGLDQFMISIFPMPDSHHSMIGLHRFAGREPFDERERTILHVVWQQTAWLHRQDLDLPAGNQAVVLTIRERQVLALILGGDSKKTAALKMGLSEHTVDGYVKALYRKLRVRSRRELVTNTQIRSITRDKS